MAAIPVELYAVAGEPGNPQDNVVVDVGKEEVGLFGFGVR